MGADGSGPRGHSEGCQLGTVEEFEGQLPAGLPVRPAAAAEGGG